MRAKECVLNVMRGYRLISFTQTMRGRSTAKTHQALCMIRVAPAGGQALPGGVAGWDTIVGLSHYAEVFNRE